MDRVPLLVCALILGHAAQLPGGPGDPRRVVLLYSYEREFSHGAFARMFRPALTQASTEPIDFIEMTLQPARFSQNAPQEEVILERLHSTFDGQRLDMVVTIGGPAATFAQKFRQQLFPGTPMLLAGVDGRFVRSADHSENDTAVTVEIDPAKTIDSVLELLPGTRTIFVVIGASQLEQFWLAEVKQAFRRFEDRVTFVWSNELSFGEMLQRCATLPPDSAIFYGILALDAKGVPHVEERTMRRLHETANAPIFGLASTQLGEGIVGGPLLSMEDLGSTTAAVAVRVLQGERPGIIRTPAEINRKPMFDDRELRRWNIAEARLPAGSVVAFREAAGWQLSRRAIVAVVVLQTVVLIALVVSFVRRRSATAGPAHEDQFRQLYQVLPVMIRATGPDRLAADVNRSWLEFTGRPRDSELGTGWLDAVHEEDRPNCAAMLAEAFAQREPFRLQYRLRRHDGEYRLVLDTAVPRTTGGGAFAGYVSSAIDVTEMEVARGALSRLSQRLMQSHEQERAWVAKELMEDFGQRMIALTIRLGVLSNAQDRGVDYMRSGIEDLRHQFSDLGTEIMAIPDRLYSFKLDLLGLAVAARSFCEESGSKHRISVSFHEKDLPADVRLDVSLALFRVLQEALGNALRHSGASQVVVVVCGLPGEVRLTVEDDGQGFDPEAALRDGGLGMVAMRERIRLVDGECSIDARRGQGTRVTARVPLRPPPRSG